MKKIIANFNKKEQTDIKIESVKLKGISEIELRGLFIPDQNGDTLLFAAYLNAKLNKIAIFKNRFSLFAINLDHVKFLLKTDSAGTNMDFLLAKFISKEPKDTTKVVKPLTLICNNLTLTNAVFELKNGNGELTPNRFNPNCFRVRNINIALEEIYIDKNISLTLKSLSAAENSGLAVEQLAADALINDTSIVVNNIYLQTKQQSTVQWTALALEFKNWKSFNRFNSDVKLLLNADSLSEIQLADIKYFAPEVNDFNVSAKFSGKLQGTVSDFAIKKLFITTGKSTQLLASLSASGLPQIEETFIYFDIDNLTVSPNDISELAIPKDYKNKLKLPKEVQRLGNLFFSGNLTGYIDNFAAYGVLKTNLGNIKSDITLNRPTKEEITIDGTIETNGFNLAKLQNSKQLGKISFAGSTNTTFSGKKIYGSMNGEVSEVYFNGYNYRNIAANGEFTNKSFAGGIDVNDDNLSANFLGSFSFEDSVPKYDFSLYLNYARLDVLNIEKIDTSSFLSVDVVADFQGNKVDNLRGKLKIENLNYRRADKHLATDSIVLVSKYRKYTNKKPEKQITLMSDAADFELFGWFNYQELIRETKVAMASYLPSYFTLSATDSIATEQGEHKNNFNWSLNFKDIKPYTDLFLPDFEIEKNTLILGNYNMEEQDVSFAGMIPYLRLPGVAFFDLRLFGQGSPTNLNISGKAQQMEAGGFVKLPNFHVNALLQSDSLEFKSNWAKSDSLIFTSKFNKIPELNSTQIVTDFKPSRITIGNDRWNIKKSAVIIDSTSISINNFIVHNAHKGIKVFGKVSENPDDSLNMVFRYLELEDFTSKNNKSGFALKGVMNGDLLLKNVYNDPVFIMKDSIINFFVNGEKYDDFHLYSTWNKEYENIDVKIHTKNPKLKKQKIDISGNYTPKGGFLDFIVNLDTFNLSVLQPTLTGIVSNLDLKTSTEMMLISGTINKPIIFGVMRFVSGGATVDFLGTRYNVTGKNKIIFDENVIIFDGLKLKPATPKFARNIELGTANVSGKIMHNYFSKINFDIALNGNNIPVLDTRETDSSFFFGSALAERLAVNAYGNLENITADISAKTGKGTKFSVPLAGTSQLYESDFISFVNIDSTKLNQKLKEPKKKLNYKLNLNLEATPDAEMQMIFDARAGDVIKGKGYGDLKIEIDDAGTFNMFGDYTIEEGSYLFTLQRLFSKKFSVMRGGTINWEGDPFNAQIDLDAVYNIKKASLYDLVPEEDNIGLSTPVDCHLYMTDKLLKPQITFGVEVPAGQADINGRLKSLSSDDLNKQMLSLLVLNKFQPLPGYGSDMSNISAGQSTGELISNQLNVWLSQISDNFDLGVNYQMGDSLKNTQVELAVSTKLWDDRVTVNSNVGVAGLQGSSDFKGDLNVDVKLNKSGKVRMKAFAQTADPIQYGSSAYTQGIGLFFREEFNSFKELLIRYREKLYKRKYDPNAIKGKNTTDF